MDANDIAIIILTIGVVLSLIVVSCGSSKDWDEYMKLRKNDDE